MSDARCFIIVECDMGVRDVGVFTGQIQVAEAPFLFNGWERPPNEARGTAVLTGVSSPHIEHAFVFWSPWQAWKMALAMAGHWREDVGRYWTSQRWVVRQNEEMSVGEVWPGPNYPRPRMIGSPGLTFELRTAQEAMREAASGAFVLEGQ